MKLSRLICMSALALTATGGSAHAQSRRHPNPPAVEARPSAAATASTPSTAATAPATAASRPPGAAAAPHARPANEPSQVLLSGAINRPGYHVTRVGFEIFAGVGPGAWAWPWGGFVMSPGFRFSIPLTRNGPIEGLNNDFRLMIGAQIYFDVLNGITPYWWLSAPVTVQWNFFLSEQWSVLLEAGLAVDVFMPIPALDFLNCYNHPIYYCDRVYFHPAGALGLRRHFSSGAPGNGAVSFRFTYPAGVQVALGF